MAEEIERKFLIKPELLDVSEARKIPIKQGMRDAVEYLNTGALPSSFDKDEDYYEGEDPRFSFLAYVVNDFDSACIDYGIE